MLLAREWTFVDAAFFGKLAKTKLEEQKLDKEEIPVHAALLYTPQRPTCLRLTEQSFSSELTNQLGIAGFLHNVNSIDEFKTLNKQEMQKKQLERISKHISDASEQFNTRARGNSCTPGALSSALTSFMLLTFADLKKYKFYYWFMFPQFKQTSSIEVGQPDTSLDAEIQAYKQAGGTSLILCVNNSKINELESMNESSQFVIMGWGDSYPWYLANFLCFIHASKHKDADIYIYRDGNDINKPEMQSLQQSNGPGNTWISVNIVETFLTGEGGLGWERNAANKLSPKLTDLSSLLNPLQLAEQAVDLNLKLMKWRAAPDIDLTSISESKCLLLGAGTLGSYISRGLLAWGVKHITFVDNGFVSYSNPVRQPLYTHADCVEHKPKAEAAANMLKQIFPLVETKGYALEVIMAGHPITSYERQKQDYEQLLSLINTHDVVFLLMDSRESRWLPTVICSALNKLVINVALGFDSYVVMRHGLNGLNGNKLGCYFCNDIVAPKNSVSNQPLDQMCTVTRPGAAILASAYAVELLASIMQRKEKGGCELNAKTILGEVYHQLRGFMLTSELMKIQGTQFPNCSACGELVIAEYLKHGFDFVVKAVNDPTYLEEISGLGTLQKNADAFDGLEELDLEDESYFN